MTWRHWSSRRIDDKDVENAVKQSAYFQISREQQVLRELGSVCFFLGFKLDFNSDSSFWK